MIDDVVFAVTRPTLISCYLTLSKLSQTTQAKLDCALARSLVDEFTELGLNPTPCFFKQDLKAKRPVEDLSAPSSTYVCALQRRDN